MKKRLFFAAAISVLFASCTINELDPTNPAETGTTKFVCESVDTKLALGDKVDGVYQVVWETDDSLIVKSASDDSKLGVAKLTSGAGETVGHFEMSGTIEDGTSVVLVYGGEGAVAEQKANAKSLAGRLSASSDPVTVTGGSASFTLTHTASLVKVAVSSSEFSGAKLNAVIFRAMDKTVSETGDYVRVTLKTPLTLSSSLQEVVLNVKPQDLSGETVYVAFDITSDGNNYMIPIQRTGGVIRAGAVSSLKVENLSLSNCVEWFEPLDNRVRGGLGYAYGDANTYLIQCKNGSTYTGGTYAANDNIPSSVTISTKARGDFAKAVDPTGATFEFCKLGAIAEGQANGTGAVYTFRNSDIKTATAVDPTKFSITSGTYSVTVTNTGAFAGAPIVLMIKNNKVLWSWTLWNIAADGTDLTVMQNGGCELANLYIGQSTDQATWYTSKSGVSLYHTVAYYQWGRMVPIFWQSYWSFRWLGKGNTGNVPAIMGPASLETALNPGAIADFTVANTELAYWSVEKTADLWGCVNKDTGTKSVYDPCPKGWRVADEKTFSDLASGVTGGSTAYTRNSTTAGNTSYTFGFAPNATLVNAGYIQMKSTTAGLSGRPTNMGNGATQAANANGRVWTNRVNGADANQPKAFMFATNADPTTTNFRICQMNRTSALPVRCQRDADNR